STAAGGGASPSAARARRSGAPARSSRFSPRCECSWEEARHGCGRGAARGATALRRTSRPARPHRERTAARKCHSGGPGTAFAAAGGSLRPGGAPYSSPSSRLPPRIPPEPTIDPAGWSPPLWPERAARPDHLDRHALLAGVGDDVAGAPVAARREPVPYRDEHLRAVHHDPARRHVRLRRRVLVVP